MKRNIICGIDVGNSSIKTVIAELNRENLRPHILGVGNSQSNGLRRGVIIDMGEVIANIGESLKQAQSMSGVKVSQAYVSLNGLHIKTQLSHGIVAVARADSEISQNDIDRVIEAASVISLPPNREIIHILPRNFIIDGQEHVKNPLGMKGVRLEADVLLVNGLSTYINNLAKCINANDIEVLEFVYTPLALAKSVLNKHQREHGVLSLDFGGGVSTLSMFYEGELVHASTIPIGSRHITNDLAIALRTSMDSAEEVKLNHGVVTSYAVSKKETLDLSDAVGEEDFVVSKRHVVEVINARAMELLDKVHGEIKKAPPHLLPAGLVFSGGGANIPGIVEFTKDRIKLAVRVGGDYFLEGIIEHVTNPAFAVAIGLILWGMEKEGNGNISGSGSSNQLIKKISGWFKNFAP